MVNIVIMTRVVFDSQTGLEVLRIPRRSIMTYSRLFLVGKIQKKVVRVGKKASPQKSATKFGIIAAPILVPLYKLFEC